MTRSRHSGLFAMLVAVAGLAALALVGLLVARAIKPDSHASASSHHGPRQVPVLALGSEARYGGTRVQVLGVEDPAGWSGLPAEAGIRWVAVEARACAGSGTPAFRAAWFDFSGEDARGDHFPALVWGHGTPPYAQHWTGTYPLFATVAPGSCVHGRLLLVVPSGAKLTRVLYTRDDGIVTAAWNVGR